MMEIDAYADSDDAEVIEESLEGRYGKPSKEETRSFQTKSGAVFPQHINTWIIGHNTIVMSTPDLNTERMSIIYTDVDAARVIEAGRPHANIM